MIKLDDMNKCPWYLFMKVTGFYPFDIFLVSDGYVNGKNPAFKWRFKNVFYYHLHGYEWSFRGKKDLSEIKAILEKELNSVFASRIGKAIRLSADDFLDVTKKTFKDKQSLVKNFSKFKKVYQSFVAIFQTPALAQLLVSDKDSKLLYKFGLSRDYAAKQLAKAEAIYRPRLGKVLGLPIKQALYLLPKEVELFLKNGKLPAGWKKRKRNIILIKNRKISVFWNKHADKIFKKEYLKFNDHKEINSVKGRVAYKGFAKGKVFVALSEEDFKKTPKNSVLVCSMTRYIIVPYLKKVKAIITDQGGITCHAAIVARELKVPTIIGTENATDVFKTGDLVEVDAERGVVRLLNRRK